MSNVHFRDFIPPQTPDDWRYTVLHDHDVCSHTQAVAALSFAAPIFEAWHVLSQQPFVGITSGGTVIPNLYTLHPNGAPTHEMVEAASHLLDAVSQQERTALCYPIDAREWRLWNNTELGLHQVGLRLEEVSEVVRGAIAAVIRASLSAQGFDKVRDVMRLNAFLGELVQAPRVFNEWSYNFSLFGVPSTVEPWGWNLFGHHLALNCLVLGEQMVLSPLFLGAEPAFADAGPFAGTRLFQDEEKRGLELMQSLPVHLQEQAVLFRQMVDPAMPPGRLDFADQRHLGGAFQDNRVISYEGACVADFTARQQLLLLDLIKAFLTPMPPGPLSARLEEIERHLRDTHFCWIGAHDETSPFYYRIQSPVVMIEYDMHSGIYLANEQPEKFHVHTIIRTPNGNDYGMDLLRLHYQQAHQGHHPGGTGVHGQERDHR